MVRHLLSLMMLSCFIMQPLQSKDFHLRGSIAFPRSSTTLEDMGKLGLYVGAAGLATYGLVKLGQWIFSQSDEQCLENARQQYQQARATYGAAIDILAEKYQGCSDIYQSLFDLSEPTLYQEALLIFPSVPTTYAMSITNYLKKLQRMIDHLAYYQESLVKRLQELDSHALYDPERVRLRPLISKMIFQLDALLNDLRFTNDYLEHHQSYFKLFSLEYRLVNNYERELQAVDTYANDYYSLYSLVHQSIMFYQQEQGHLYPYRVYVQRLQDDLDVLAKNMQDVAYNYYYRLQTAEGLRNKLEIILQVAINCPAYNDELQQYEYAHRTKKRSSLEGRARALEQEANELRHQRQGDDDWWQDDGEDY